MDSLELGTLQKGRITYSMYSMYLRCAMQFAMRYIEGRIEPPKGALILGRGTHKGLEWGFREHIEKGKPPPRNQVIEATVAGLDDEFKEVPASEVAWNPGESRDSLTDDAVALVSKYDPIRVQLKPRTVEKPIEVEFTNTNWKLTGRVDLETDTAIIDHKTTGKSMGEDAAQQSEQLTVYGLQAPKVKSLELHVLVRLKDPKVQILKSAPRSQQEQSFVLENIAKVVTLIRAGIFPKALEGAPGSPCSWCGYYEACRGKKRQPKKGGK